MEQKQQPASPTPVDAMLRELQDQLLTLSSRAAQGAARCAAIEARCADLAAKLEAAGKTIEDLQKQIADGGAE